MTNKGKCSNANKDYLHAFAQCQNDFEYEEVLLEWYRVCVGENGLLN